MRKFQTFQPGGFWLVTVAAVLWGTIGVATQAIYNVDSTSSLFINLARMVIAAPVLLLACWRVVGRKMFSVQRRDLLIIMLSGILLATSQGSYFAAIHASGVTIPTLLAICIAPIVVTCVSVLLKFETLTRRILIALVCALAGSILLVGFHSPEGPSDQLLPGIIFSVISAVTYAGMIICGRFLASDYHPLQVTAFTFSIGAAALFVINLLSGVVPVSTSQGLLLVLYLGLVPTALAYWLFQSGLRSVSATTASILGMLDPLVTAALAWVLFNETLGGSGILGAGLLILSVYLLSTQKAS